MNSDKISIKINKVGANINSYISSTLISMDMPECFGHAYPDVISLEQEFNVNDITVFPEERSETDTLVAPIISNNSTGLYQDRYLTQAGIRIIEDYKRDTANAYAAKLVACSKCDKFVRCNELTKNYAQAVSMRVMNKLSNI